ncbi:MAG: nitroreductase family deazaflavin-dependent oxidoreductase [Anaerolineae bacterium]
MENFNQQIIDEFRSHHGKVTGYFENSDLLLLTTKGAKSGKETTTPVVYSKDGDRLVIIASKGGAPTHPSWYHNLIAHPVITVEVGTQKFKVRAHHVTGEERTRLYNQHAHQYPGFKEYQAKTTRVIPVFVLERI